MKTYTKTIEGLRLVIRHDEDAESPREWENLGHFITCESRYNSPDDNEDLKSLIQNLGDEAESVKDHVKKIKEEMPHNGYGKVLYIYPVYKYEHGGVAYHRGTAHGFDYSNCGFYIVTDKTIPGYLKEAQSDAIEYVIDSELETYTKWVNGEVYEFTLYDEDGNVENSCGGFYDVEDIREYLPDEWKDEDLTQYMV